MEIDTRSVIVEKGDGKPTGKKRHHRREEKRAGTYLAEERKIFRRPTNVPGEIKKGRFASVHDVVNFHSPHFNVVAPFYGEKMCRCAAKIQHLRDKSRLKLTGGCLRTV